MATNPFVNNISYKPTQDLLEELSIESIKSDILRITFEYNKISNYY